MKVLQVIDVLAHLRQAYEDNDFKAEADTIQSALCTLRGLACGESDDEPMTNQQLETIRGEWAASSASYHEKRAFIVTRYRTEHLEAVPSSAFGELVQWLQTGEYEGLMW